MSHLIEKSIMEAVKDLIQSVRLWTGQKEMDLTGKNTNVAV